jgi:hypothetical protein
MAEAEALPVGVMENLSWFYRWLCKRANTDIDLELLDLSEFDQKVMTELIAASEVSAASRDKSPHGTGAGGKGSDGDKVPTFNGQQAKRIVWDKKSQAHLSQNCSGRRPGKAMSVTWATTTNPAAQSTTRQRKAGSRKRKQQAKKASGRKPPPEEGGGGVGAGEGGGKRRKETTLSSSQTPP